MHCMIPGRDVHQLLHMGQAFQEHSGTLKKEKMEKYLAQGQIGCVCVLRGETTCNCRSDLTTEVAAGHHSHQLCGDQ